MSGFGGLARILMLTGGLLLLAGAVLYVLGKIPYVGKLPGDISYHRGNFTLYFPLATSILLSLVLTLLLNLIFRRR